MTQSAHGAARPGCVANGLKNSVDLRMGCVITPEAVAANGDGRGAGGGPAEAFAQVGVCGNLMPPALELPGKGKPLGGAIFIL